MIKRMDNLCGGIDFEKELNEEQYAAVSAPRGPALVLAGAGSGKTRTLTYRVAWLRERERLAPWQILLLTFTNKAAREMISRVEGLTGDAFKSGWGGTFHSVGARILRRDGRCVGLEPGFTIMDQDDAEGLFSEVAKGLDKGFFRNKEHPKPSVLLSWLSYARNTQRSITEVVEERRPDADDVADALIRFAEAYRKKKIESQVADYDDLLTLWLDVLRQDAVALERYRRQFAHILVDEYQDTNAIQSAIIDLLAGEHQIMAVGDDAQCIYTWRGADFDNILHFPDRHPGTRIYNILSNYRSTQPILDLANDVLDAQAAGGGGYEKRLRAVRQGRFKPVVVPCADTVAQARFVIERTMGLLDEGLSAGQIAVLYRAHYQALDLQLELSRRGVPFTITSGIRFFEQAHIRDMVAQLRLIVNPADEPAFGRICTLLPKVGPKTALKLHSRLMNLFAERRAEEAAGDAAPTLFDLPVVQSAATGPASVSHPLELLGTDEILEKVPEAAQESWRDMAETLHQALDKFRCYPEEPSKTVDVLIEGWYGGYLTTAYDRSEERLDDLKALLDFANGYDSMSDMLAQLVLLSSESNERKAEAESGERIRLSTIHQAKGLEFSAVFLIGASEGSLPLQRAVDDGNVDEERRLFYVAVTRAEDELYICHPMLQVQKRGGAFRLDRSRFIDEIGPENFECVRPRLKWGTM